MLDTFVQGVPKGLSKTKFKHTVQAPQWQTEKKTVK